MSRLGLGLGITKGGLIPFNPLSLDPYLFFDSRSSMIGTLENPTLDLDPANPETLDVITATRTGVATYTDADGLIQSASPNTTRVDYTQGAELTPTKFQRVNYTDFSSGWVASNTTVIAGDGFGGHASHKITAGSSGNKLFTGDVSGVTSGTAYTISFYVKSVVGSGRVDLIHNNITGTPISQDFTITSEFTRVTAQFNGSTSGTTATNIQFRLFTAGDQIEISQPQFEEGTTATTFVENTTGSPKFITGATYGPRVPMILVEPSSENLITRSEDFSFSGWTKNGASVANGISSPDGNNTAFKLTEDATGSGHYLQETVTVSSATIYTASIFVKYESREWIRFTDAESINRVHFNTRTGQFGTVVGTVIAYSSTELDDGWHRITITSTSAGTAYSMRIILAESDNDVAYTGDGTSGIYVWGAQLEAGSVATSLIPTSGGDAAARTRAADDLVISGSAFSSFFNTGGDGTFFVTAQIKNPEGQHATLRGGSNSQLYVYSNADAQHFAYDGGSNVNSYGDVTENQLTNFAVSYNSSNFTVSKDGSSDSSLSTTGNLSNATRLEIGTGYSTGFCGHFRRIIYWPYSSDRL